MDKVAVVIPNYNGRKLLENCLGTLEKQTVRDFKVLVIDNGSTDHSTDLQSDGLDLEMIALPENLGFCGAVNLGISTRVKDCLAI